MGLFCVHGSALPRLPVPVGRRTQYWIIYTVDDETRIVDVLHFWNAMRDPESLEI